MRSLYRFTASALVTSVLVGCATVNPAPDYQRARQHVAAATGSGGVYAPGDEEGITQRVNDLLADGLVADEAVEIALLNNPGLQELFQEIGVAQAEVVQSGLLSNPSLGLSFRFPAGGGRSNVEASIAQELVDLWQIPARKRAAQRELDTTVLEVAHRAAQLAADARGAYYDVAAADRNLEIAVENVAIVQKLLDAALARKQAGVVGELDVNLARGVVMSAELDVRSARLDTRVQRRRLASLLGLTRHAEDLVLRDGLVTPACADLDGDRIVRLSLDNRLDVRAAANAVAAAAEKVELEYRKVFPSVELGLGLERSDRRALPGRKLLADTARASIANGTLTAPDIESRAQRQAERRAEIDVILGPSLDLTLPIFDQNQAQIARAKFEYEQAVKGLDSLERQLIQDTRDAVERATTASETARDYETKLLPQANTNLELSRESYRVGAASLLVVLEAQQFTLETRKAYIVALQTATTALVDLERITGQPMARIVSAGSGESPTTTPSSAASPVMPNEGRRQEDEP